MDILAIIYKIIYNEEHNIHILIPEQIIEGVLKENVIISGNEKINQVMDSLTNENDTCYVDYLELDVVKNELENNNIPFNEGIGSVKEKYFENTKDIIYFIENGELKYLTKDEFKQTYSMYINHDKKSLEKVEYEYTCKQLVDEVKKSIFFQDKQIKRIVSTIIGNSYFTDKKKIILNGKSGTGKTKIIDIIAELLDSPIAKINGYMGEYLTNAYFSLYTQQSIKNGPPILFVDGLNTGFKKLNEIDADILISILKQIIDTNNQVAIPLDANKVVFLDTSKINFIIALDLEKYAVRTEHVGFGSKKNDALSNIRDELIEANFDIIDMNMLTEDNLLTILKKSQISPINEYREMLDNQGTKLVMSKNAYDLIANNAFTLQKGAKGLRIITDRVFCDYVAEAQYRNSKTLTIDDAKVLKKINQIKN